MALTGDTPLRTLMVHLGLLLFLPSSTKEVSLGGGSPLYGPDDKIFLLNTTNFQPTVCGSEKAWLVEFYSSWCGHCIHFAPTFKELANDIHAWREVISVAAIDCALDENMPTCREYEVMGYPSIKYFAPNTLAGDMGEERQSRDKTIPAIKLDTVKFLKDLQANKPEKAGRNWPRLLPTKVVGLELPEVWEGGVVMAVLLVEQADSNVGTEVMLDLKTTITKLGVPLKLARVEVGEDTKQLMGKLGVGELKTSLVAINKDFSVLEVIEAEATRKGWYNAIKDFIWNHSSELSLTQQKINQLKEEKLDTLNDKNAIYVTPSKVASKKELINRRYKAFTSDLEKAVLYSISHEVAQHSSIAGHTLEALQEYVTVLEKYFPARIEMAVFLRDLHSWVHMHQDTVRGEDLSAWIQSYQGRHGIQANDEWIGCKGSEDKYGGYPCGLWSLWHALTVQQANLAEGDPKEVLKAMFTFIKEFFGCRECARHFDKALEGGKAIEQEVETFNDAILLLWRAHNKANFRLHGDISEDPVYPKQVFPPRDFCTGCYNMMRGSSLWDEFDRPKVVEFLKSIYSKEKLSSQGLMSDSSANNQALAPLAQIDEKLEHLDVSNFRKEENSTSFIFFNGADISICFMLWGLSALLLMVIYLKFVSNKKFSNTQLFNGLKRKTSSMNPLIGKV